MLKEIIGFVDKWEDSTIETLNDYPDINLITVTVKNDLSIDQNSARWLEGAELIGKYFDKPENEKFKKTIYNLKKTVAPLTGNKALGSTSGLMTASPYGFKLFATFFEACLSNGNLNQLTKINKNYGDKLLEDIDKTLLESIKNFLIKLFNFEMLEEKLIKKKIATNHHVLLLLKFKLLFPYSSDFRAKDEFQEEINKYLEIVENNQKINKEFAYLNKNTYLIFLLPHEQISEYSFFRKFYLKEKCFISASLSKKQNDLVCPVCLNSTNELGVPDKYNNANASKHFLFHIDTKFIVNVRVCLECAQKLCTFSEILKDYKLSIFPVFVSTEQNVRTQLNDKTFRILSDPKKKKSFMNVIRELKEQTKGLTTLRDFYLFIHFIYKKKNNLFIDYLDCFNLGEKKEINIGFRSIKKQMIINDIFDFFYKLDTYFFNEKLSTKFFIEPEDDEYKSIILKYRGVIFDIIYRSKHHLFKKHIMDELIRFCLRYHINMDIKNKRVMKPERMLEIICEYESLLNFFNYKGGVMTIDIKNVEKAISSEGIEIALKDEDAAYLAGQIVYYLLSRSKAASKTHALAERFFNLKSIDRLKSELIELTKKYNHALSFGYEKFNNAVSIILQFETNKKFNEIEIPFYAGYFDKNLFYEKRGN